MNQEIKNRFDFDLKLELKKNGDKIKEKREIGKKFITENQQHEKKRLENEKESKENDKIWLQAVLEKEQLIRSMEINEKVLYFCDFFFIKILHER